MDALASLFSPVDLLRYIFAFLTPAFVVSWCRCFAFHSLPSVNIFVGLVPSLIAASAIPGGYYYAPNFLSSNRFSFCLTLTSWSCLFNDFSNFYCFAVIICVRDVISAFRSIAWLTSRKKWLLNSLLGLKILWTFTVIKGQ